MKLTSVEKNLVREARRAIASGKLAVAGAYLRDMPDCYEVRYAKDYLKSVREDQENYEAMSNDERNAHDNL